MNFKFFEEKNNLITKFSARKIQENSTVKCFVGIEAY